MKIKRFLFVFTISALLLSACSENETDSITLTTYGTTELYSVTNQSADIKFNASGSWKASCTANWLTFSPKSGKAGNNTITVSTTATNRTKNSRYAQLVIESGGQTKKVGIKQRDEYAIFDTDELNLPSDGATVKADFHTNLEKEQLHIYFTIGLKEWLKTTES